MTQLLAAVELFDFMLKCALTFQVASNKGCLNKRNQDQTVWSVVFTCH